MDDQHSEEITVYRWRGADNMKIELYRDGKLWMSVQSVGIGSEDDIAVLPKRLIKGSSLSHESFENLFFSFMKDCDTNVEAYERTESKHEEFFETRKYSSYDSFRKVQSTRLK